MLHDYWSIRGNSVDNDRLGGPLLHQGTNEVVLKIQNGGGDWGFVCRLLEISSPADQATCPSPGNRHRLDVNSANDLRYNWDGSYNTWSWDSGLVVPNRKWTFAALVVQPQQATIYMSDGTILQSAINPVRHGMEESDGETCIGRDPRWNSLAGSIDEVRIYDYALSEAEIREIFKLGR